MSTGGFVRAIRMRLGSERWASGSRSDARAILTQTAGPHWRKPDPSWFAHGGVLVDGPNSHGDLAPPAGVAYRGISVPDRRPQGG